MYYRQSRIRGQSNKLDVTQTSIPETEQYPDTPRSLDDFTYDPCRKGWPMTEALVRLTLAWRHMAPLCGTP